MEAFFDSVKGKTVAFIGIGTSNLPLIRQFAEKGVSIEYFPYTKGISTSDIKEKMKNQ